MDQTIGRALTLSGYECVEAINGLEAVKLATSQSFLIILMDLTV
jgi:CheY-like chemotaxis protein